MVTPLPVLTLMRDALSRTAVANAVPSLPERWPLVDTTTVCPTPRRPPRALTLDTPVALSAVERGDRASLGRGSIHPALMRVRPFPLGTR